MNVDVVTAGGITDVVVDGNVVGVVVNIVVETVDVVVGGNVVGMVVTDVVVGIVVVDEEVLFALVVDLGTFPRVQLNPPVKHSLHVSSETPSL